MRYIVGRFHYAPMRYSGGRRFIPHVFLGVIVANQRGVASGGLLGARPAECSGSGTRDGMSGPRRREDRIALLFCLLVIVLAGLPRLAWGDTLEIPVGSKAVSLGESHVACGPVEGGWVIEPGARTLRAPTSPTAVGTAISLKVAATLAECPSATASTVTVVATGPWPAIEAGSVTLALDEERLEVRGHGLAGISVAWTGAKGAESDTCRDPRSEGGLEVCTLRVPRTLSADPAAESFHWAPSGARLSGDATFFNADGKQVPASAFALMPARVELKQVVVSDASVDVSGGVGLIPLTHREAVASVDCGAVRCALENDNVAVQAPPAAVTAIDVRVRLLPHVFFTRKAPPDPQPVFRVAVLRCPMEVASGPPLRNLDSARIVVHVGGGCAKDIRSLNFLVGARRVEVVQIEAAKDAKDGAFAVLAMGTVDAPSISVTATREEGGEGAVVAFTKIETRRAPVVRTVLEIHGFPPVDFIPTNRPAIVHYPKVSGAELVLLPLENVYVATFDGGASRVQADPNAAGSVTLQFGYRVPALPAPLDKVDLGVLSDSLQRGVREANIPAPFGIAATSPAPLVELLCTGEHGETVRVNPGVTAHVHFRNRDDCRVVFHRDRLSPEYGAQKLVLNIDVNKVDGSPRGEARVDQTFVMRSGTEQRTAWIKGVSAPYDRAIVKLSHSPDESHYLGATELVGSAPIAQWTILFGTGRVRLYATTAIPTGLYRLGLGDSAGNGAMSLSFGVISRFTWLEPDGKEGLLGLEAGVMAFALTGDQSQGAQSLTQVGAVVGAGMAIPIANPGAPTQASINLHLWFEQRLTGNGPQAGSEHALIFGPSISFGNIGTTF